LELPRYPDLTGYGVSGDREPSLEEISQAYGNLTREQLRELAVGPNELPASAMGTIVNMAVRTTTRAATKYGMPYAMGGASNVAPKFLSTINDTEVGQDAIDFVKQEVRQRAHGRINDAIGSFESMRQLSPEAMKIQQQLNCRISLCHPPPHTDFERLEMEAEALNKRAEIIFKQCSHYKIPIPRDLIKEMKGVARDASHLIDHSEVNNTSSSEFSALVSKAFVNAKVGSLIGGAANDLVDSMAEKDARKGAYLVAFDRFKRDGIKPIYQSDGPYTRVITKEQLRTHLALLAYQDKITKLAEGRKKMEIITDVLLEYQPNSGITKQQLFSINSRIEAVESEMAELTRKGGKLELERASTNEFLHAMEGKVKQGELEDMRKSLSNVSSEEQEYKKLDACLKSLKIMKEGLSAGKRELAQQLEWLVDATSMPWDTPDELDWEPGKRTAKIEEIERELELCGNALAGFYNGNNIRDTELGDYLNMDDAALAAQAVQAISRRPPTVVPSVSTDDWRNLKQVEEREGNIRSYLLRTGMPPSMINKFPARFNLTNLSWKKDHKMRLVDSILNTFRNVVSMFPVVGAIPDIYDAAKNRVKSFIGDSQERRVFHQKEALVGTAEAMEQYNRKFPRVGEWIGR